MRIDKTKPYSPFLFIKKRIKGVKKDTVISLLIYTFLVIYLIALVFIPMADRTSQWYIVTSSSMEPTLNVGDMVYVSSEDSRNIKKGDIITFVKEDSGAKVTHRCIEVVNDRNELYFRTKGDANEENDSFIVHDEDIIGKINSNEILGHTFYNKIPRLGYLSKFANTFLGFVTLILLPGFAMIGMEAYNIVVNIFSDENEDIDKLEEGFNELYDRTKSKLKTVRDTDIDLEKLTFLIKKANHYSKEGDYKLAIENCEETINIIESYTEYNNNLSEMKHTLERWEKYDEEYFKTLELLELSKDIAGKGDYASASNIINSFDNRTILRKKS